VTGGKSNLIEYKSNLIEYTACNAWINKRRSEVHDRVKDYECDRCNGAYDDEDKVSSSSILHAEP